MGDKSCANCFAPLADGFVCVRCGFDNAAYRPQPHHLPPGALLRDKYVVGRAMGQGGFGITYAGFDPVLDRRVAVKEYFPEGTAIRDASRTASVSCYASKIFQKRYGAGIDKCLNEAKALAKLDDIPGIVRVLDYFQANNTAYVIMEFVEGVTLAAYLQRQPQRPTFREALALLSPVGAALGEIHSRGFVHRDVSPDNIMIDRKGRAKLLDFGAVKTVTEGGAATETPVVKRGFSPAEMYSADGMIGPWSDVYAYCATLYYVLTGAAVPEPMNRLQNDTLGESLSRAVSPAQAEALQKGLAIKPDQRCQTIAEMTAALDACRNDPAPLPKTEPLPLPATEVIAGPAPQQTEPVGEPVPAETGPGALPETVLIDKTVPKKTQPAAMPSTATERYAPGARIPAINGEPPAPAFDLMGEPPPRKRRPVILAVVLTLFVALCLVAGYYGGRQLWNGNNTSFTIKAQNTVSGNTANPTSGSVNVGDYVTFGRYEQDNDTTNGKEAIEWLVLAKEDGKALLISRYGLANKKYNEKYSSVVTWDNCTLRTWLNGTFYNSAFSEMEQGRIVSSTVTADANPDYSTSPGNSTTDRIFLLSINEANDYFDSDEGRKCRATAYANAQGAYVNDTTGVCWWWLRSPGSRSSITAFVSSSGRVRNSGEEANHDYGAVRPAMWVNLAY